MGLFFVLTDNLRFRLVAPHYLEMDFRCRADQPVFPRGYRSLFWASYMNAPANKSLYFPGGLDDQRDLWMLRPRFPRSEVPAEFAKWKEGM